MSKQQQQPGERNITAAAKAAVPRAVHRQQKSPARGLPVSLKQTRRQSLSLGYDIGRR